MNDDQRKFIDDLIDYFEGVSELDIEQDRAYIPVQGDSNCGCFGAHIAKCFDKKMPVFHTEIYDYTEGAKLWRRYFDTDYNVNTPYLEKHGAGQFDAFGAEDWANHPVEVLKSIREELTDGV